MPRKRGGGGGGGGGEKISVSEENKINDLLLHKEIYPFSST